jgi:hypothetical protein
MKLTGTLTPIRDLTALVRDELFELFDRHFDNVRRDRFEQDLQEKEWVILLADSAGRIKGFSTQRRIYLDLPTGRVVVLFSGDTIVAREAWGDAALAHVWGRLALALAERHSGSRLYWYLLSKGFRTYRFLPVYFHEFDPHPNGAMSPESRLIRDRLGQLRYGAQYDPLAGLVRADDEKDRLRSNLAQPAEDRRNDPFIRFFLERNPGHDRGDELCCVAPIRRANFTPLALRVIGRGPFDDVQAVLDRADRQAAGLAVRA